MGALGDHGPGRNDGIALHHTIVHDDTAHAHQHIVLDGATVHDGIVTYGNVVANGCRGFLISAVDHGAILYIYLVAHFDEVHITANHGIEPDTALVAHGDLAHNGGVLGNKAIFSYFRGFTPYGFEYHSIKF